MIMIPPFIESRMHVCFAPHGMQTVERAGNCSGKFIRASFSRHPPNRSFVPLCVTLKISHISDGPSDPKPTCKNSGSRNSTYAAAAVPAVDRGSNW